MSMHKIPLSPIEEAGIIAQFLGQDIGKPSMAIDLFRAGVRWGQMTDEERGKEAMKMVEHGMPCDPTLRARLAVLAYPMANPMEPEITAEQLEALTKDPY